MNPFCGAEDAEEEERGEHQRRGHIIVGLVIVECEQIHPNSKLQAWFLPYIWRPLPSFFLTIPNRFLIQQQLLKLWWR
jgi:hypothetical protein